MPPLTLVAFAPDCAAGRDLALRLGEGLVAILNADAAQPGPPPLTAEAFLAETVAWCHEHAAQSYAIVCAGECVGMISLSHIDERRRCARSGWILASRVRGQGLELAALKRITEIARGRGLRTLGGKVRKGDGGEAGVWAQLGARFEPCDPPTHRLAVVDIGPLPPRS